MSSCGPSYFCPSNTSGAAYGGLPHHVAKGCPGWKKFPKPKSESEGKEHETRILIFQLNLFCSLTQLWVLDLLLTSDNNAWIASCLMLFAAGTDFTSTDTLTSEK